MPSDRIAPWWLRVAVLILAFPQLLIGVWVVLDTRGWYDGFPGPGPALVAADPPYNAHLASDAGAGFLGIGVALAAAAAFASVPAIRAVLLGAIAFFTPHAMFHAANPADGLSGLENTLLQSLPLAVSAVIAVGLLLLSRSRAAGG